MKLFRSAGVIAIWTLASRILGFARDILIANLLGAGPMGEAFVVAFRLPNLFRRLFADGALLSAIVPVYSRIRHDEDIKEAKSFVDSAFSFLLIAIILSSGMMMLFMTNVVGILAPGFEGRDDLLATTSYLALLTFPYLGCMVLSSFIGGILNVVGNFWTAAAAPVILNILMITALLLSYLGWINYTAEALSFAVLCAGGLQLLLAFIAAKRLGIMPTLAVPKLSKGVKQFFKLMLPGILGAGVIQINMVVGTQIASTLDQGAVAYLYYADRLTQLPMGLVGVALGSALLPLLGKQLQGNDPKGASNSFSRAMEMGLILALPATIGLILIGIPLVQIAFQHGAFSQSDSAITGLVTMAMALSIPAGILIKMTSAVFFAKENAKTPMYISLVAVAINIPLALGLSQIMGVVGVALAASLAAMVSLSVQLGLIYRWKLVELDQRFRKNSIKIAASSMIMGLFLYIMLGLLERNLDNSHIGLFSLISLIIFAGLVYFGSLFLLKGASVDDLKRLIRK